MWASNLCMFLILFTGLHGLQPKHMRIADTDWDYLLFTQHWPPTVCVDWVEKNPKHTCSMPVTPDSWTIHGIWPTKLNTYGPQFCNNTWRFDPEQVRSIETPLEQYWKNIEAGTDLYSLWAHEWSKHGTCAAMIEPLNSEFKYFSKGLEWLKDYNLTQILAESNVVPSDDKTYTLDDFYNAVKAKLNVGPQIECRSERGGKQYLFEIRLCFNRNLTLIDCHVAYRLGVHAITNCEPSPGIIYPASYYPPQRGLLSAYKLAIFLQWFTL